MEKPEFIKCGITITEYESCLHVIEQVLNKSFTDNLRRKKTISVWDIILVQNRSTLLDFLKSVKGFNKVRKQLISQKATLESKSGYWFQLTLGRLLMQNGEEVEFEYKLGNTNVDISLRGGMICIECKGFDGNIAMDDAIKTSFTPDISYKNSSPRSKMHPVDAKNLNEISTHPFISLTNTAYILSSTSPWAIKIEIDESQRFLGKLDEKMHQLIKGVCNVKAIDITALNLDPEKHRFKIASIFEENSERYKKLSCLLLIRRLATDLEIVKMKGKFKYQMAWILNPNADAPMPSDLIAKFSY